jgi:hypothetical protein
VRSTSVFLAIAVALTPYAPVLAVDDFDAAWMARELALKRAQAAKEAAAHPWPRPYLIDGVSFVLFQPQPDSWTGGEVQGRAVMAVTTGMTTNDKGQPIEARDYGIVWLRGQSETVPQSDRIVLSNIVAERADFPTAHSRESKYQALASKAVANTKLVIRPED